MKESVKPSPSGAVVTRGEPFFIVGPTASGKSSLALALAERWDAEVVNADAFQVYRDLGALTASPTQDARERCPHHLYQCVSVSENYNVSAFAEAARTAIKGIRARGRRALVVGGSGLYVKALTHGLSGAPSADPVLRRALERLPLEVRVGWLKALDPQAASTINLQNPRYLTRALEICLRSGRPNVAFKSDWRGGGSSPTRGVYLAWQRDTLYERINARTAEMLEAGAAIDEVRKLGPKLSRTARQAIGIGEILDYLAGGRSLAETVAAIQLATRRYAKRQMTWFRRETLFLPVDVSESDSIETLADRVAARFRT